MSFGSSARFKTMGSSGRNRNMATHKAVRDYLSPRYDVDDFEHIEHTQPNLRKLVQLLANTVPELVGKAQSELKDTTLTSSTVTEDKELKRENEDLRKQIEKLELILVQQGKLEAGTDIAILQAKKDELETRLDHEIRHTSELERPYKDEIYNLQQTINKQKKEIDNVNTTATYEIRRLKAEVATKEERHASMQRKHESYNGLDRECQKLRVELKDTKAELATKEERHASMQMKHESYNGLDRECQKLRIELKDTKAELDDTKTRLSKIMGDKLTYNNPNIADLSDENRPTKIAERFQEIYDNQWTDAFECLYKTHKNEEKTISALISILNDTMLFCEKEAEKQMNQMKEALTQTSAMTAKGLPQNVMKQIIDMRKAVAEYSGQNIYQLYEKTLRKSTSSNATYARLVPEFVEACFTVCWLMTVQDPPVVFGPSIEAGEAFNSGLYKAYTKSGSIVEFVVWPALCMHKGGAVLCKGVAQGCGRETRRTTKSAPPDGRKRNENKIETNPGNYTATVKVPRHDAYVTRDLQSRSYWYDGYSQGRESEPRNQPDHGLGRGISYQQTTTFTRTPPTYMCTQQNPYQSDIYSSSNLSQKDMDNYFWYTEHFGKEGARRVMGKTYDIVVNYLK